MEIFFEGIHLRPWLFADAEHLARIADSKLIADNLRDGFPSPYSLDDALNWLGMVIPQNDTTRFFAIVYNKQLAGSIGIVSKSDIYRKNAEIGYYIGDEFRGKGIATRAIRAVTSYAFSTFDIIRVYAEPFYDNQASRRALEKAGFIHEATLKMNVIKNGVFKDSCIYSVLKEGFQTL